MFNMFTYTLDRLEIYMIFILSLLSEILDFDVIILIIWILFIFHDSEFWVLDAICGRVSHTNPSEDLTKHVGEGFAWFLPSAKTFLIDLVIDKTQGNGCFQK